jgi:hypothetical protein
LAIARVEIKLGWLTEQPDQAFDDVMLWVYTPLEPSLPIVALHTAHVLDVSARKNDSQIYQEVE